MAGKKTTKGRPEAGSIPGYYFVRYQFTNEKTGRTTVRFKDQNGRFVSFDKVQRSKRKIYDVDQRSGKTFKPKGQKTKPVKGKFLPKVDFDTSIYAQSLGKDISSFLAKGRDVGLKVGGKIYRITLDNFQDVQTFQAEILKRYFAKFKTVVAYPQLSYGLSENEKTNRVLFDLDNSNIFDEDVLEDLSETAPEIAKDAAKFKTEIKRIAKNYFDGKQKKNRKRPNKK